MPQLIILLYLFSHFLQTLSGYEESLEQHIQNFFTQLCPVAYLHVINSASTTSSVSSSASLHHKSSALIDFHDDYKNCLTRSYDKFRPFGETPQMLAKSLMRGVSTAAMFLKGLTGGAEVLIGAEQLDVATLDINCKQALLRMTYCSSCRGYGPNQAKPCYGYCMNVMRGCLNLYMGQLNKDWNSFTEAIPKLNSIIRAKESGIETVIKTLDQKLSEAIMYAMENGPAIDEKVGCIVLIELDVVIN